MRIRMKTIMAGPTRNAAPGQVIDVPKAEAYTLIEAGAAEQVEENQGELALPRGKARRRRKTKHAPETAALEGGESPEDPGPGAAPGTEGG